MDARYTILPAINAEIAEPIAEHSIAAFALATLRHHVQAVLSADGHVTCSACKQAVQHPVHYVV